MKINIEIKKSRIPFRSRGLERRVIAMVDKLHASDRVIYSSFSVAAVRRVKRLRPNAEVGLLVDRPAETIRILEQAFDLLERPLGQRAVLPAQRALQVDRLA